MKVKFIIAALFLVFAAQSVSAAPPLMPCDEENGDCGGDAGTTGG